MCNNPHSARLEKKFPPTRARNILEEAVTILQKIEQLSAYIEQSPAHPVIEQIKEEVKNAIEAIKAIIEQYRK